MPNKSPYLTALGCYLWPKNWAAHQVPTAFSKPLKMELLKLALSICFTAVAFTLDNLDGQYNLRNSSTIMYAEKL